MEGMERCSIMFGGILKAKTSQGREERCKMEFGR